MKELNEEGRVKNPRVKRSYVKREESICNPHSEVHSTLTI